MVSSDNKSETFSQKQEMYGQDHDICSSVPSRPHCLQQSREGEEEEYASLTGVRYHRRWETFRGIVEAVAHSSDENFCDNSFFHRSMYIGQASAVSICNAEYITDLPLWKPKELRKNLLHFDGTFGGWDQEKDCNVFFGSIEKNKIEGGKTRKPSQRMNEKYLC